MKIINYIKKHTNIILTLCLMLVFSFITIGFASYQQDLSITGSITIEPDGKVEVVSINLTDSSNVSSSETPTFSDNTINFDITFSGSNADYYAEYTVDIENNSSYDYTYNSINFTPTITGSSGGTGTLNIEVSGIEDGEILPSKSSKTITLKLVFTPSDTSQSYDVEVSGDIDGDAQESGSFIAELTTSSIDLTGSKSLQPITLKIYNTYSKTIEFTPTINNSAFKITNSSGGSLGSLSIAANTTQEYTLYVSHNGTHVYYSSPVTTNISITCTGMGKYSTNSFDIEVDETPEPDTTNPVISSISISKNSTEGVIDVSWQASDNSSGNISYEIKLYNASTNAQVGSTLTSTSSSTSVQSSQFTDISQGTSTVSYYATITATDESGNSASSTSSTISVRWLVSVTYSLSSVTASNSSSTTAYGSSYTTTLSYSGSGNGTVTSSSVTVTMKDTSGNSTTIINGGSSTDTSKYTYSSSKITINEVTGDITITASGQRSCLIEGTLIRLADGSTKKIENITYNDLLLVWDYEHGKFVYEYPIWIEKTKTASSYQKTTFSDGTILKTHGYHGVYSSTYNEIISVDNPTKFKVGTKISKYDESTNKFIDVTITKIETIYEKVNYYHVVSTRYYNIIANNLLTTDGTTILTNLYGFNDDMTWKVNREEVVSNKDNLYTYKEFSNIMPYYLFVGLRAEEGKYLNNMGYLSQDMFTTYLLRNQLNKNMWLEPSKNIFGNRSWLVTTSNNTVRMIIEGSIYTVPNPNNKNNFLYWYNHADNKYYYPGDKLTIWTGTYLEAIYK